MRGHVGQHTLKPQRRRIISRTRALGHGIALPDIRGHECHSASHSRESPYGLGHDRMHGLGDNSHCHRLIAQRK